MKPLHHLLFTFCIATLLVLYPSSEVSCQKLGHVLGDFLVELAPGESIHGLTRQLQSDVNGPIETRQLIKRPKNIWLLHVDQNQNNEDQLLDRISENRLVLAAQKNHITTSRAIPNDPKFTSQWQYINDGTNGGIMNADLDMDLAWDITTGGVTAAGDTIVVCVVDDGINLEHMDLKQNLWTNHAEIPNNGIDDDNNGYIDDHNGWNAYQGGDNVTTDGSHGTPVAGIIGAVGNNGIGVAGVNWNIKLMIVEGGSPESSAIASYAYAYNMRNRYNESDGSEGAFVVATNSSWGVDRGQPEDAPIWCDFYNLLGEVGILSCGATANSDLDVDVEGDLPTACQSDYLISVTNLRRDDNKENAAGYGVRSIDLGAYGEDTYTVTKSSYGAFGGTSGATPHVAGVIGLIYSIECDEFIEKVKTEPQLSALAVKDYILTGVSANQSIESTTVTGGKLNAHQALLNSIASCEDSCSEGYGLTISEVDLFEANGKYLLTENTGAVQVRYRKVGTLSWTTVGTEEGAVSLSDLEACTTYEYQSRTQCNTAVTDYGYLKIFETEGCCEAPSLLSLEVNDDIAIATWSEVLGANQFTVEYKLAEEVEWNSITLDGMSNQVTIPGITPCTAYDFRVMATCDITDRESTFEVTQFSGPCGNCTEAYCEIDPKDTSDEWIDKVEIEDVFINQSGDNNGYGSFVGLLDITLEQGVDYTLRLTPGYSASSFTEVFSVYIDYNQDASMSESERIFIDMSPVNSETVGTFVVPADAVHGITRMRVIMRFSEANESSCDSDQWSYGEYEDYCVNIVPAPVCPPSLNVVSAVDSTTSTLSFEITTSSLITEYEVRYLDQGQLIGTSIFDSSNIYLQDLNPCTVYDIELSASCVDGNVSTGTIQLKTSCSTSTIEEEAALFTIFPNPAKEELSIRKPPNLNISSVALYDMSGGRVLNYTPGFSEDVLHIDGSDNLLPGVYIVKIHTENGNVLKKWLKIN